MQGIDYAYTLHGWLKTINGNEVTDGTTDMGGDGRPSAAPQNPTACHVVHHSALACVSPKAANAVSTTVALTRILPLLTRGFKPECIG
ncbi:MAG: hypothetical protein MUF24_13915 [Chitinophagaceae bacterium]|nr:hypothetical protein [Chitinophagaceae bacterium]